MYQNEEHVWFIGVDFMTFGRANNRRKEERETMVELMLVSLESNFLRAHGEEKTENPIEI